MSKSPTDSLAESATGLVEALTKKVSQAKDADTRDGAAPDGKDSGGSATDEFQASKERLRSLTKWIIGIFGGIALVMIAGTQLSDLGSLDPSADATLFGFTLSRFDWAVIGLGVALGGTAFIIALCVWVQISSDVSLVEILTFPEETGWRILGWRVRAHVRIDAERDLELRAVALTTPKGGGTPSRLHTVLEDWHDAHALEHTTRLAALKVEREDHSTPRATCRRKQVTRRLD